MQITWMLAIGLFASILTNAFQAFRIQKNKKKKVMTYDAQALLHDLTSGRTILKIDVLDKAQLFLRSPRDM